MVPYVPRLTLEWLDGHRNERVTEVDGTAVLADLSGFTSLSERLAAMGREGAERLSGIIDSTFAVLLEGVYAEGGRLLAFGGDALLLMFSGEDHTRRAARAASGMRRSLRAAGRHTTPRGIVQLRMSIGIHSGTFALFLVGSSHRQLMLAGSDVTRLVAVEKAAGAGEIVVTPETALRLPARCVGPSVGPGRRLVRVPGGSGNHDIDPPPDGAAGLARQAIPVAIREHLLQTPGAAELRAVTVGFVQLETTDRVVSGSTSEAAAVLEAITSTVQAVCEHHGVTFLAADVDEDAVKLLLVSGAPTSRGDDEERMLLVARDIVEASLPLPVRIGVHRGTVFVGDIGPFYRRTYTVMGDAVNTAARLMSKAAPDSVLSTHEVVDRCRARFLLTDEKPLRAKGKKEPIPAVVVGPVLQGAAAPGRSSVFVGREPELHTLLQAWAGALAGTGDGIQIVGEAGIGKSALLGEFVTRLEPKVHVHVSGDLYSASSPYQAARSLIREVVGLPDDAGEAMSRLTRLVQQQVPTESPWLPLLGDVFGVSVPDTAEVADINDERRRDRLHSTFTALIDGFVDGSFLVTVEDAHWVDDASAAIFEHLAGVARERCWLLVSTRRDGEEGFSQLASGRVLHPAALGDEEAARLVEAVGDQGPLTPAELSRLISQAAGNPLFLRELAAAAREGADLSEVPDTLDALLAVRLDRLGFRDRDLVRRAAVLGSRFVEEDVNLVVAEHTTVPGPSSWARLGDFVVPVGAGVLEFSHALVRDVAYGSLPFRTRRELHGRVADAMQAGPSPASDAVLSYHCLAAGRWRETWDAARRAGEAAMGAYAPVEAAELLERALVAARHVDDVSPAERADVGLLLAKAHERSGSFAAAARAYAGVRGATTDPLLRARSLTQQAWLAERQSRLQLGIRRARAAQRELDHLAVDAPGRRACLAAALTAEGTCWEVSGRHDRAIIALQQAADEATLAGDERTLAHAGSILDWALAMTGVRDAGRHLERSLQIYRELGDLGGQATCLTNLGALAYLRGDWAKAVDLYRQGQAAQLRSGDVTSAALGAANIGEVLSDQGHWAQALESLDEALRVWRSTGHQHGVAYAQGLRGRVLARMGRDDEAAAEFERAVSLHRQVGADGDARQAELWRGESLTFAGAAAEALACLGALGDDQSATAARVRATALWQVGDLDAARRQFDLALERAVEDEELYEQVAVAGQREAFGDVEEAGRAEVADIKQRLGVVQVGVAPANV
jgi:class 3 adenylate cyclase/predicted ATPase